MESPREIRGPNGILRGIVHHPTTANRRGACIILHGYFSSTHIGPARLYVRIARLLANLGYCVWRFDCYGIGNSEGDFEEASYSGELADYQEIAHTVVSEIEPKRLILAGHSMGTNLAVRLACTQDFVTHLLLLSPSFGNLTWPENLFTGKQLKELQNKGFTFRKGLKVKRSFVRAFQREDIFDACKKIHIPTILVYGKSDKFYSRDSVRKATKQLESARPYLIDDAGHNFLKQEARNKVLDIIRNSFVT